MVYDEPLKLNELRSDLHFYPVPFDKLVGPVCPDAKLRKLVRNMIYDGVVAQLLGIDMEEIRKALVKQFGKKKAKAAELNWGACKPATTTRRRTFTKTDPYRVERMNATAGKIIIDGNAGVRARRDVRRRHGGDVVSDHAVVVAGGNADRLPAAVPHRPETGKATYAVVQAEDELASIGMVLGAGWAGARSMTSTAGPGISLMSEFVGLGYYAEVPAVIFDVQRVGPSTGLPTRTQQGDLLSTRCSRTATPSIRCCFPCSPKSASRWRSEAFDLAEQFQTPVFVNDRSGPGDEQLDVRSVRLSERSRSSAARCSPRRILRRWAASPDIRMWTATASAIARCPAPITPPRRTSRAAAATTRRPQYTEREDDYINNMDRLRAQVRDDARAFCPSRCDRKSRRRRDRFRAPSAPRDYAVERAAISCGTSTTSQTSYLRLRAYPFTDELTRFHRRHDRVYVVDQNRDGADAAADAPGVRCRTLIAKLRSVRYYGGLPLDARTVTDDIVRQEGNMSTTVSTSARRRQTASASRSSNYKGGKTTLCAGCGHNSISERIVECFYEMGVEP